MSAYAIAQPGRTLSPIRTKSVPTALGGASVTDVRQMAHRTERSEVSVLETLIDDLVDRVATAVAAQLRLTPENAAAEWLDSRGAADYLGVHRDTIRKLAAERAIPAHQDGPRCKLFFRRSDLDEWRRTGGGLARLSSLADAA